MVRASFTKFTRKNSILLVLFVFLLPGVSMAQQYYDPGLLQRTIDRKPVDYQPPGMRLGGFVLGAGAEAAYENNDNIYYLPNDEVSDSISTGRGAGTQRGSPCIVEDLLGSRGGPLNLV